MPDSTLNLEAPKPVVRPSRAATTGDTVTVACKLPSGLILRAFTMEEHDEPLRDGSTKKVQQAVQVGEPFVVRGPWLQSGGRAFDRDLGLVSELLPGGYAITRGVPKDLWDAWYRDNRKSPYVERKLIFAIPDEDDAKQEAIKNADTKSGLEPVDPDNPAGKMGRIDRRLKFGVAREEG